MDSTTHERNRQRQELAKNKNTEGIGSVIDQIKAVIYGQCIGDAIGLLTEFMSEHEAKLLYGKYRELEYEMKCHDGHRDRWEIGDWTDDSDQMILLLESLTEDDGQVRPQTFATKLRIWARSGFRELGDKGGCGIGRLTAKVIGHRKFKDEPHKISHEAWINSGRQCAPNGGVMRTSIMGVHQYWNIEQVMDNAVIMCTVTHFDPRCTASVVAVSTAISLMLQRKFYDGAKFDVWGIINESYTLACRHLPNKEHKEELKDYMSCKDIAKLKLAEEPFIGYTFKCVGAGFWALKQDNFRLALQTVAKNAGDADTNGAVAGALLGCKLGLKSLPASWLDGLLHKNWLDEKIDGYLKVLKQLDTDYNTCPVKRPTSHETDV